MSELVKKIEDRLAEMIKIAFGIEEKFLIKSVYGNSDQMHITVIFGVYGIPKDFVWHFNVGRLLNEDETVSTNP